MSGTRQLRLLLWRNLLIQRRRPVSTVVELVLPCLFAALLVWMRTRVKTTPHPEITTWPEFRPDHFDKTLCPQTPFCPGAPWRLYYAPETAFTERLMARVMRRLGPRNVSDVIGFPSEDAAVTAVMASYNNETKYKHSDVLGVIVFDEGFSQAATFSNTPSSNHHNNHTKTATDSSSTRKRRVVRSSQTPINTGGKDPVQLTFKIRLKSWPRNAGPHNNDLSLTPKDGEWKTGNMFPLMEHVGPREIKHADGGHPGYFREGFLALEQAVGWSITEELVPEVTDMNLEVLMRRFPFPPFTKDLFVITIQSKLPMLLMLGFVFIALVIVKDLVHEKEKRLKESMKLMGLQEWCHWIAWFIHYFLFLLIIVCVVTSAFSVRINGSRVLGHSDPTVIFVFLSAYACATVCFCFMISSFFSKANSGAAAGGVLFFVSYMPYFYLEPRYTRLSSATKFLTSLSSNIAMAMGARVIGTFEGNGAGVQWSSFGEGVSVDDKFTMSHAIAMLLLDSFLYCVVTWYVTSVYPGQYGVPQPWHFPFKRDYWFGAPSSNVEVSVRDIALGSLHDAESGDTGEFFEAGPRGLKPGIVVKGLRKEFGRGDAKRTAVDGMNLTMYEGQLTALLGHNGAGKTTTMAMLTGFIPPTSGTAIVNGYDIRCHLPKVRSNLGLCPQHDILYNDLTVEEHLTFFATLKGCRYRRVPREVATMLKDIGLVEKKDALASTLSGGQKRKLSVGIALIAGSKIVIFDEPTSGMDPNSRRHTWDLLQRMRSGRTLVLSTHYMDEADVLGDRIAIMAEGKLQCCGSTFFLKNKYGAGYHMVISKTPQCEVSRIVNLVKSLVPAAQVADDVGAELSCILPQESASIFPRLFDELERQKEDLGIASYGASVTTMEEVFLKVGKGESMNVLHKPTPQLSDLAAEEPQSQLFQCSSERTRGPRLWWQQMRAMSSKRLWGFVRSWPMTLGKLIVPMLVTSLGIALNKTFPSPRDSPPLVLDVAGFGNSFIVFGDDGHITEDTRTRSMSEHYASQFDPKLDTPVRINNILGYETNPDYQDYLSVIGSKYLFTYINRYPIGASFNKTATGIQATALFNDEGYHAPAISLSAIHNAILRTLTDNRFGMQAVNHPLPRTSETHLKDILARDFEGPTISLTVTFSVCFLAASFAVFTIRERSTGSKHLQFVSGVRTPIYWFCNLFFDTIQFILACFGIIFVFFCFNLKPYVENGQSVYIVLLFLAFCWGSLPLMYIGSFLFHVPSSGLVWLAMFNIVTGVFTIITTALLSMPEFGLTHIATNLDHWFTWAFPMFALGDGLKVFYRNQQYKGVCQTPDIQMLCRVPAVMMPCCRGHCGDICILNTEHTLSMEKGALGPMLVALFVQGTFWLIVLVIVESGFCSCIISAFKRCVYGNPKQANISSYYPSIDVTTTDDDVEREKQRIMRQPLSQIINDDMLVLSGISKQYGKSLAVKDISLGVAKRDCFGLLGINGAGKTSTFKMITGDVDITKGNVYLQGMRIGESVKKVHRVMGYCPQFDALLNHMTGRETLTMYARLRGIPERSIPDLVQALLDELLLWQHADKQVGAYSGGNKRKLSTAIALIGDPPILLLDEPTSGMDPVARRQLWNTLSRVRARGTTLVLTSHSMEECEALCTRLAIMVKGQFKCLGSPQHLKSKFGDGYTLITKMTPGADKMHTQTMAHYIESNFPGCVLKDIHQGVLMYHIPLSVSSWSRVFATMERAREQFCVEDYSVSQTTLEQVFINFARADQEEQEKLQPKNLIATANCCRSCWSRPENPEEPRAGEMDSLLGDGNPTFERLCDTDDDDAFGLMV